MSLEDIANGLANAERVLTRAERLAKTTERTSDSVARARGAIAGHEGVVDQAHNRRETGGIVARTQRNWATVALEESRQGVAEATGHGREEAQPQQNGTERGQGQTNTGNSRSAQPSANTGQDFVDAVVAANNGNTEARDAAVRIAAQFTQNGRTQLPVGNYDVGVRDRNGRPQREPLGFDATDNYASPEEAVSKVSAYLASKRIGTAVTVAAPANGTAPVNGAPEAPTVTAPVNGAPAVPTVTAPVNGAPANGAPAAPTVTVGNGAPAAPTVTAPVNGTDAPSTGTQARNYGAGQGMPKINTDQVREIQQLMGGQQGLPRHGADGKWGPETQTVFLNSCQRAGVNAAEIDFTNPNDPETKKFTTYMAANPLGRAPAPVVVQRPAAPDAAQTAAVDAQRMTAAVATFTNLSGADTQISAAELAAVTAQGKLAIGRAFDLDNDGRVESTELRSIATAAAAQAKSVTVAQGVNISSLFEGTPFGAPAQMAQNNAPPVSPSASVQAAPRSAKTETPLDQNSIGSPLATPRTVADSAEQRIPNR